MSRQGGRKLRQGRHRSADDGGGNGASADKGRGIWTISAIVSAYDGAIDMTQERRDRVYGMLMDLEKEQMRKMLLPENVAKGSWEHDHPLTLYVRLVEEMAELREELHLSFTYSKPPGRHLITEEEYQEILSECADVANFAAMIADVCSRLRA